MKRFLAPSIRSMAKYTQCLYYYFSSPAIPTCRMTGIGRTLDRSHKMCLNYNKQAAIKLGVLLIIFSALTGCARLPILTSSNDPKPPPEVTESEHDWLNAGNIKQTDWMKWDDIEARNIPFIGVALSGGGTRSALFGATVLEELSAEGILENATAISSVSGGSLAAAYYALFRPSSTDEWKKFRDVMSQDLIKPWLMKLFNPVNMIATSFTDKDRSDLMAEVFDENIFHGMTFSDLSGFQAKLLINATEINTGYGFGFSNGLFQALGSRIDNYPIAKAVMASGAFPGVFNAVTLQSHPSYDNYAFRVKDIKLPFDLRHRILHSGSPIETNMRALLDKDLLMALEIATREHDIAVACTTILNSLILPISHFGSTWHLDGILMDESILTSPQISRSTTEMLKQLGDASKSHVSHLYRRYVYIRLFLDAFKNEIEKQDGYIHFIDGGPADNLGVEELAQAARNYYSRDNLRLPAEKSINNCLFIVIDAAKATSNGFSKVEYERDLRSWHDMIIDKNVIDATDAMLRWRRETTLNALGLPSSQLSVRPAVGNFSLYKVLFKNAADDSRMLNVLCKVWHISLERLKRGNYTNIIYAKHAESDLGWMHQSYAKYSDSLHDLVSNINTNYKLVDRNGCPQSMLREGLESAARNLVRDDIVPLSEIKKWFSDNGIVIKKNRPPRVPSISWEDRKESSCNKSLNDSWLIDGSW